MSGGTVTRQPEGNRISADDATALLALRTANWTETGNIRFRMGVLDRATNKIGTASAQVVVP